MRHFVEKLRNLCEILLLPRGLRLKFAHPNFHWRDYRMCLRLRAAGVDPVSIYDVGANEGQFAIGALEAFPSAVIHSYEPGREAFQRLKRGFVGNPRMRLANLALGESAGMAELRVTNTDQSSSLLRLHQHHIEAYPHVREIRTEEVRVSTLADEFRALAPARPVLLKIDTQGFELEVLRGSEAVLDRIDWIVLETSTVPMYSGEAVFAEVAAWLTGRGFSFRTPVEIHLTTGERPCQFDALFVRQTAPTSLG